jgi:hypothetical protein
MRTWKNAVARTRWNDSRILTEGDYEAAGRIKNALSQDARAAWLIIKQDRQLKQICRRTFMLLCDVLPDGRLVRRRPTVAEVRKITGASEEQIKKSPSGFSARRSQFPSPPFKRYFRRRLRPRHSTCGPLAPLG